MSGLSCPLLWPVKGFTVREALCGLPLALLIIKSSMLGHWNMHHERTGSSSRSPQRAVIVTTARKGVCGLHLVTSHLSFSRTRYWIINTITTTGLIVTTARETFRGLHLAAHALLLPKSQALIYLHEYNHRPL
uniref:Uncharacterized protein n=1 Tax=Solanum tuberosum TaxID=4113 RepID=M1DZB2_SOLTU